MATAYFEPMGPAEFQAYMQREFDKIKDYLRPDGSSYKCSVPKADFDSTRYKFDHQNRGLVLVFSNEKFLSLPWELGQGDRPGSEKDSGDLEYCFYRLGFHRLIFQNLTAGQMKKVAKKAAERYKHEDADCFVCVVMSHGDEKERRGEREDTTIRDHVVYGCDGNELPTKDIVEAFSSDNCAALIDKPRLFFIQSCRGPKTDHGVSIAKDYPPFDSRAQAQDDDEVNLCKPSGLIDIFKNLVGKFTDVSLEKQLQIRSVPLYQDSLVMYATPPGYLAWEPEHGSHLIYVLQKALMGHTDILGDNVLLGDVSLLTVLTRVSQELSQLDIHVKVSSILRHLAGDKAAEEKALAQLNEDILIETSGETPTLTRDSTMSVKVTQMAVIDTMLTKDVFMTRKIESN